MQGSEGVGGEDGDDGTKDYKEMSVQEAACYRETAILLADGEDSETSVASNEVLIPPVSTAVMSRRY